MSVRRTLTTVEGPMPSVSTQREHSSVAVAQATWEMDRPVKVGLPPSFSTHNTQPTQQLLADGFLRRRPFTKFVR